MVGGEERGREVVRQGGREGGEGYVVVFFGGGVGWGGDDMGKMVWMVRVGREWGLYFLFFIFYFLFFIFFFDLVFVLVSLLLV